MQIKKFLFIVALGLILASTYGSPLLPHAVYADEGEDGGGDPGAEPSGDIGADSDSPSHSDPGKAPDEPITLPTPTVVGPGPVPAPTVIGPGPVPAPVLIPVPVVLINGTKTTVTKHKIFANGNFADLPDTQVVENCTITP